MRATRLIVSCVVVAVALLGPAAAAQSEQADAVQGSDDGALVVTAYWDRALLRAGRAERLCVRVENPAGSPCTVEVSVPDGLSLSVPAAQDIIQWGQQPVYAPYYSKQRVTLEPVPNATVAWDIIATAPCSGSLSVLVQGEGLEPVLQTVPFRFLPPVDQRAAPYVPEPEPVEARYLVGAMYFPGWKPGFHVGWSVIEPYPERQPALGWYDESNPEVTDWEIKWALEHGISFFMYCWYRARDSVGGPVEQLESHAIHEGFFKARYAPMFQFCIMWENGNAGGVQSEEDLMTHLFPYWLQTYFRHPSYLLIDNKPVLGVYDIVKLMDNLGGAENVKRAVDRMRKACVAAGFSGLWILAEHRFDDPYGIRLMAQCGLDASFAYCWQNIPHAAPPETAVQIQVSNMAKRVEWNVLPNVPTLSMGWNCAPYEIYCGWGDGARGPQWRVPPQDFEALARKSEPFISHSLAGRMVLLDNWNEFGEGHYIAPCRQNGFGYLDAVRKAFCDAPEEHTDLLPEEVGLGPYDVPYKEYRRMQSQAIAY